LPHLNQKNKHENSKSKSALAEGDQLSHDASALWKLKTIFDHLSVDILEYNIISHVFSSAVWPAHLERRHGGI